MEHITIIIFLTLLAAFLLGVNVGMGIGALRVIKIWKKQIISEYDLDEQEVEKYIYNKIKEYE